MKKSRISRMLPLMLALLLTVSLIPAASAYFPVSVEAPYDFHEIECDYSEKLGAYINSNNGTLVMTYDAYILGDRDDTGTDYAVRMVHRSDTGSWFLNVDTHLSLSPYFGDGNLIDEFGDSHAIIRDGAGWYLEENPDVRLYEDPGTSYGIGYFWVMVYPDGMTKRYNFDGYLVEEDNFSAGHHLLIERDYLNRATNVYFLDGGSVDITYSGLSRLPNVIGDTFFSYLDGTLYMTGTNEYEFSYYPDGRIFYIIYDNDRTTVFNYHDSPSSAVYQFIYENMSHSYVYVEYPYYPYP